MSTIQLEHKDIQNSSHDKDIILIAEHIISPTNYGMITRTAEAFGVSKVIFITYEYDEFTNKMKKTSRSTEKYVDLGFEKDIVSVLEFYKNQEYTILALERTNDSVSINDYNLNNDKIVIVTGSESVGVSQVALDLCDQAVDIPMYGTNSSMNLVVATGVSLNAILSNKL